MTVTIDLYLIDLDEFERFRNSLIRKYQSGENKIPNRDKQRDFLQHVKSENPAGFLQVFDEMPRQDGKPIQVAIPDEGQKFTQKEISEPPASTEKDHFSRLNNLPPRIAALPTFWATYQLEMIRRRLIQPNYLAAPTGLNETGRTRIGKALNSSHWKDLDDCVRRVLRQMGGLRSVRGKSSTFTDCKIAQAWWRGYLINQAYSDLDIQHDRAWELLRLGTSPWLTLIEYATRRLTVLSERPVRSAVIKRLIDLNLGTVPSKLRQERVVQFLKRIGQISATRSLGALTPGENFELFSSIEI